jgi:GGDEF domain-containing protein
MVIIEFSSMVESSSEAPVPDRALIVQLAALLRSWVDPQHLVGHLRDREFAVLVHNLQMREVEHLADDIVNRVRTDPSLENRRGQIATIVGLGYCGDGNCEASRLMSLADIALHYAQSTGRSWHAIIDKPPRPRAA